MNGTPLTLRTALAALALVAALAPAGARAQTVRLGYLDPDLIVVRMPQYASVQQQLRARQQEIATGLQVAEDSIRTKFQELQALGQSAVASASAREQREQEILQMQAGLERRQQAGLQELGRREAELLQPILDQLQTAIDAESAAQGLTMVLAARANNAPVLLFASDAAVNLTEPVMTRLGIELPAAGSGTPAATATPTGGDSGE